MRPSSLRFPSFAAVLAGTAACANSPTAPAAPPAATPAAEVRSFGDASKGTSARVMFTDNNGGPVNGATAEFTAYPGSAVQFKVQAVDNGFNDLDPTLGSIRASLPDAPWGSIVVVTLHAPYYATYAGGLFGGAGTVPSGAGSTTSLGTLRMSRLPFIQASYMNPDTYKAVAGAGLRVYRLPANTLVRDVSDGGSADDDPRAGYVRVYLNLAGTYRIVEKLPPGYTPIGETAVTRTIDWNGMAPVSWLLAPTVSPK